LPEWYADHLKAWSDAATSQTTLWFWNTEIGWATMHPYLVASGWTYRQCNIWDKGISHAAGNSNTKTLRSLPVVTEVCALYVREPVFEHNGEEQTAQAWLRSEWERTGLPFSEANIACGVKNAATRKYLTKDHLWYSPPPDMFVRMAAYANEHGKPEGRPYFVIDGELSMESAWSRLWSKFHCEAGLTNVWSVPSVRGKERLKVGTSTLHANQKPLELMERCVRLASDPGDVVWEPFGGLCTVAVACRNTGRRCFSAECDTSYRDAVMQRLYG
jgi:site-specific DNA-methyltransferase (adenine-specific)